MPLPASVEALRNERTGKLFIVLDLDVGDNKAKVINPTGDVLDVVKLIFKMDEPLTIAAADFSESFSEAQLAKLNVWEQEVFAEAEKKRLERAARLSQKGKGSGVRARSAAARKEGMIDRGASSSGRRPVAEWSSSALTFYRHRIEALKPNEIFAVNIEGHGTLSMTKSDFQRVFNNVIMNADYRNQGFFTYSEIPEAALPFIL